MRPLSQLISLCEHGYLNYEMDVEVCAWPSCPRVLVEDVEPKRHGDKQVACFRSQLKLCFQIYTDFSLNTTG